MTSVAPAQTSHVGFGPRPPSGRRESKMDIKTEETPNLPHGLLIMLAARLSDRHRAPVVVGSAVCCSFRWI